MRLGGTDLEDGCNVHYYYCITTMMPLLPAVIWYTKCVTK